MSSAPNRTNSSPPSIFRLLLDARESFPYSATRIPTLTWASTGPVPSALSLLPSAEQARVQRFHFPKDAALSLASYLLKHTAILRAHPTLPWSSCIISQKRAISNGKPFYTPGGVQFNVSHHGEAAVLVGTSLPDMLVGIDLARVDMDKDVRTVQEDGWERWAATYRDVFSEQENRTIRLSTDVQPGSTPTIEQIVKGLRCFYSHWALKEAYAKMTGEGLMADWLQDLEFGGVEPPSAASEEELGRGKWAWGQRTRPTASFRGQEVEGVQLELWALGEHYMVATAVGGNVELPAFESLDVERDIMPLAQL